MLRRHPAVSAIAMLLGALCLPACGAEPVQDPNQTLPDTTGADVEGTADVADAVGQQDAASPPLDAGDKADVAQTSCPGGVGCPCTVNAECDYGFCLDTPQGQVCAATCVDHCGPGAMCKLVNASGGDTLNICVPAMGFACDPCTDSKACQAAGHPDARCVRYDLAGGFCGVSCAEAGDCALGYGCQGVVTVEGEITKQCVRLPSSGQAATFGTCPCSPRAVSKQLATQCQVSHPQAGGETVKCEGARACKAAGDQGLTACDAPAPKAEVCNSVDDDCDGKTDEGTCDDNDPCTKDLCDPGGGSTDGCAHSPDDGQPCDDGNKCSIEDKCKNSQCMGGTKICVCESHADCAAQEDGDLCNGTLRCNTAAMPYKCEVDPATVVTCKTNQNTGCLTNTCDAKTGTCVMQPVADGTGCDDGDACSVSDACKGGKCQPGTSICDCQKDADCADQEDGDLCNGTLFCDKAKLPYKCAVKPTTVVSCAKDLDTACAKAACQPKTGQCALVPVADGGSCDDGNACTVADTCKAGKCQGGSMICTCEKTADCAQHEDGDLCNGTLVCDTSKVPYKCVVDAKTLVTCDPAKDTACAKNACAPATGQCAIKPVTDGAPCSDGDECTVGDKCAGGKCASGTGICGCQKDIDCAKSEDGDLCNGTLKCDTSKLPYACALDPKTVVTCDGSKDTVCAKNVCGATTGVCALKPLPEGKACDDGDACTGADQCKSGACAGTAISCDDKNPCTDDACAKAKGCTHVANAAACDDGNACTLADQCNNGKCVAGPPPACNDKSKNGNETDIDCGGSKGVCGLAPCGTCAAGKGCAAGSDCASKVCTAGKCQAPSCSDKVLNGTETAVDCGGSCPACSRLFLLAGGPTVFTAIKVLDDPWQTQVMTDTTVDGVSLAISGDQQVWGALRYTKLIDPLDNVVRTTTWSGGKWTAFASVGKDITTRFRPAIAASESTAYLMFSGMNYKYYFAKSDQTGWGAVEAVGNPQAYGPAPPSLATMGGKAVALYIDGGLGNHVVARVREASGWGSPKDLGGESHTDIGPTLAALGGTALACWVRKDGQVMAAEYVQGAWKGSAAVPDAWTVDRVAVAQLGAGGAVAAFRGTNGTLYATRQTQGVWGKPVAMGPCGAAPPAIAQGIQGHLAELVWIDAQGHVMHARLGASGWSTGAKLGISASHVALVSLL